MKTLKTDLIKLFQEDKMGVLLLCLNFLLGLGLFVFAVLKLNPNSSVVKIGYGDIGGYRDGTWTKMLVFPLVAILLGVFHNFLAIKIFSKRGVAMMKFFLITTIMLILGTLVVLIRLLREG